MGQLTKKFRAMYLDAGEYHIENKSVLYALVEVLVSPTSPLNLNNLNS